jgi:hypothetical protein
MKKRTTLLKRRCAMFARLGLLLAAIWCGLLIFGAKDPSQIPGEAFVPALLIAGLGIGLTWVLSALFR